MAANQGKLVERRSAGVDDVSRNARDRQMGREGEPLGDLGKGHETWKPPAGEQGMSNRPDDDGTETDSNPSPLTAAEQQDDSEQDDPEPDDDEEFEDEDDEDEGEDDAEEGDEATTDADDVDAGTKPSRETKPGHDRGAGNDQKGGDRSNRAAVSGASGERSTSGGQNKPPAKNQDEKGMGHPRNR